MMVPVRINGKEVGCYDLSELFSKYGNWDGDNYLLREVALTIIERMERELGVEVEAPMTVHNDASVAEIREGGKVVWENLKWGESPPLEEVLDTMPEGLRRRVEAFFEKLAEEGIDLEF